MAWTEVEWSCGHTGEMQLYGKYTARENRVASEAGRQCFVCWLLEEWERTNDPRAKSPDRVNLALSIARNKGIRINYFPSREALIAEKEKLIERIAEIDKILENMKEED